jgi:predicted nucleotidyltransferase
MIDLNDSDRKIIEEILAEMCKKNTVYIYGSRAKGLAKKFSDVDLFIREETPVSEEIIEKIREKMAISDLPLIVDLKDWYNFTEDFKPHVKDTAILIY